MVMVMVIVKVLMPRVSKVTKQSVFLIAGNF